ncbi:cytochrome P450 [Irpex rosettiformis]|uniref:Cytochrome P450 n=1 Tax=Irpex rosettiformis TaxID=378272 RepID=A0ACB8U2Q3_9APHY|nr:cytochrome P450 [Irpex rosettiformis]
MPQNSSWNPLVLARYLGSHVGSFFNPKNVSQLVSTDVRLVSSVAVLVIAATWIFRSSLRRRYLTPGPPRHFLFGNLLQLPSRFVFKQFSAWTHEYGPIFSIDLLGQHIIVVGSNKTATDLLERRSHIYSNRTRLVMVDELLTQSTYLAFAQYGDLWRRLRRASHTSFNSRAVKSFEPFQTETAAHLALHMIGKPTAWEHNLEIFATSSMFSSVYGRSISPDSPYIKRSQQHITKIVASAAPGAHLCDLVPPLKLIPTWLAPWKRDALAWHEEESRMFETLYSEVEDKKKAGQEHHGFMAELIDGADKNGLTRKQLAWLAGSMVGAGADTTAVTLINFVLAMLHYPGAMRKAQAELDAVVGQGRPPTFDDMPNLPYIRAMVKETLRWRPIAPLAALHLSTEDDWYDGHFIPKGSTVIANIWDMNRDPAVYPDFDVYRPERFLDETGKVDIAPPDTHNMGHVSFGFGKRICIGLHFTNQTLFISIAMMLWALDFQPVLDKDSKPIIPSANVWHDEGLVVRPEAFGCRINPRFPEAQAILEASLMGI